MELFLLPEYSFLRPRNFSLQNIHVLMESGGVGTSYTVTYILHRPSSRKWQEFTNIEGDSD